MFYRQYECRLWFGVVGISIICTKKELWWIVKYLQVRTTFLWQQKFPKLQFITKALSLFPLFDMLASKTQLFYSTRSENKLIVSFVVLFVNKG